MGRIRYLTLLLFVFVSSWLTATMAQDTNYVRAQIAALSSPAMFGRGGAHNGEGIAAAYLRQQLQTIGALPLAENGFQRWATMAHKMEGTVTIATKRKMLNPLTDYRIAPFSHSLQQNNIPIIRIDASLLVDTPKMEQYIAENQDVLKRSLLYIDAEKWKQAKKFSSKSIKKSLRGLTENNPFQSKGVLVGVNELPVLGLSNTDFQRNYSYIYLKRNQLPKKQKTLSVHFSNEYYRKQTQNVCFAIDGTTHPDEFVVFIAHYDHLGCMGDSVVFPGAHDNAAGTSAVLDFARHYSLHPPRYTTLFLLLSGEESGLKGSKYFVENPLLPLEKVKLVINLDMFCGGDDGITVVNSDGDGVTEFFQNMLKINDEKHYLTKIQPRKNAPNSDHYFFSLHCPALFIYTLGGQHGDYHEITDTCENCGLRFYPNIFALLKEAIETL